MHLLIDNSNGISRSLCCCCWFFHTQPGSFFASIQCRLFPALRMWWTASGVLYEMNYPATIPSSSTSPLLSLPLHLLSHTSIHSINQLYFILYYVSNLFVVVRFFIAVLFTSTQLDNFPRKLKKLQLLISDNINYFCSATSE